MTTRERQVVAASWGRYLERLRGKRKPALVLRRLRAMKIPLTRGTLWQYEHGTVAAPDPVVLAGLAAVYGTDLRCVISVLHKNRLDPNLSDNDVDRVLRDEYRAQHATAEAAAHLAEIQDGLRTIAAELIGLGERSDALAGRQVADPGLVAAHRAPRTRTDRR